MQRVWQRHDHGIDPGICQDLVYITNSAHLRELKLECLRESRSEFFSSLIVELADCFQNTFSGLNNSVRMVKSRKPESDNCYTRLLHLGAQNILERGCLQCFGVGEG